MFRGLITLRERFISFIRHYYPSGVWCERDWHDARETKEERIWIDWQGRETGNWIGGFGQRVQKMAEKESNHWEIKRNNSVRKATHPCLQNCCGPFFFISSLGSSTDNELINMKNAAEDLVYLDTSYRKAIAGGKLILRHRCNPQKTSQPNEGRLLFLANGQESLGF